MSERPLDPLSNPSDGGAPTAEPTEFAFAEVAPDGSIVYVNPYGASRWGWTTEDAVPDEMLFMLAELLPGASQELPFMQGGLFVSGIRRGETDGWIVVGYERRPAPGYTDDEPLQTLIDRMPVAAVRMKTDGTVVFANPETMAMTGYPPDEIAGYRFWSRVIVDDDRPSFEEALRRAAADRTARSRFAYRTATGRVQHVDMHLFLTDAYFIEAVVLDRPLDSEDALLLHAKLDAEQATRQKTAFIATLSHEIRTPLGSIRGFAELLGRELAELESTGVDLPPTLREFADAIDDRTRRLVALVQDLLELSTIEMGHLSVEQVPVRLHTLIRQSVDRLRGDLETKGLTLGVQLPGDPIVATDAKRLGQILDGLLSNAVKFTNDGSVSIRTTVEDEVVTIEIADTGIGMSEGYRNRMFAPFSQEEDWINRSHDGVGLGLALVRRLVDLLGARVDVDSRKDVGTCFRLYLPVAD